MGNYTLNNEESIRPAGAVDPDIDPLLNPQYYDGVLIKRVMAYAIDVVFIGIILGSVFVVFGFLGLITFGVTWVIIGPVMFLIPFAYHSILTGGPESATFGMRFMNLQVRRWVGGHPDFIQAAAQTILFYGSIALTAWLILVVAFFDNSRRCLHDYFSGTVVVNNLDALGSINQ